MVFLYGLVVLPHSMVVTGPSDHLHGGSVHCSSSQGESFIFAYDLASEIMQYHFLDILLVINEVQTYPDPKEGGLDSTI